MAYEQQQAECEARFEMVAKEASLRQRDCDDKRLDGGDEMRFLAAANSTIRAQVCAMDYAALEGHKRAPAGAGSELTPEASEAFGQLGFQLDEFIQPGEAGLAKRRHALALALVNPAPGMPGNTHFQTPVDYDAMAESLNAGLPAPLHRQAWQARDLAEAAGRVHQVVGVEGAISLPVFKSQHSHEFLYDMAVRQDRSQSIEILNGQIPDAAQWPVLAAVPLVQDARRQEREELGFDVLELQAHAPMDPEFQPFAELDGNLSDDSGASMGSEVSEAALEPHLDERDRESGGRRQ